MSFLAKLQEQAQQMGLSSLLSPKEDLLLVIYRCFDFPWVSSTDGHLVVFCRSLYFLEWNSGLGAFGEIHKVLGRGFVSEKNGFGFMAWPQGRG